MPHSHFKFLAAHLPEDVTDNVVYTAPAEVIVVENGQLVSHQQAVLNKSREHHFIKQVIKQNKVAIFRHLLANRVPLHLSDIYLACQHGYKELVQIIMDTGKIGVDTTTK